MFKTKNPVKTSLALRPAALDEENKSMKAQEA
jgi:hypothetical protein